MSTLTDRYVWAAVRTVREDQRPELESEVRALVADATEAHAEQGSAEPEHDALTELGDPERLAASYVDRPLYLVGPRHFLDYWRLLKLLVVLVVPLAVVAILVIGLLTKESVGDAIGGAIATGLQVFVQICFWTTAVFALVDRTPSMARTPLTTWTPKQLPELPRGDRNALPEFVATVVFLALLVGALVWQQLASPVVAADGTPVPVLQPALWTFWIPAIMAVAVLEAVFAYAVYRSGWTVRLAVANTALSLAAAIPVAWLTIDGRLLNPAFFAAVDWPEGAQTGGVTSTVIVVAVVLVALWDIVDGFIQARRARLVRASAAEAPSAGATSAAS